MALLTVACGTEAPSVSRVEPEAQGTVTQPIVNGKASSEARASVVFLGVFQGDELTEGCSGVMVAPNLAMTAKHCIFAYEATACDPNGVPLQAKSAQGFGAPRTLVDVVRPEVNPEPIANNARFFAPDSKSFCRDDIALILLDKPIPGPVAPLRWDRETKVGELTVVAGYGTTNAGNVTLARNEQAGVRVVGVGPVSSLVADGGTYAAPPRAINVAGGAICSGDSGAGVFSAETGALIGLPSRIAIAAETPTIADCLNKDNPATCVDVSRFKSLVEDAFRASGYMPWIEGKAHPFEGKVCTADSDCAGIPCSLPDGICQQSCGPDLACPTGLVCGPRLVGAAGPPTAGATSVCAPPVVEDDSKRKSSSCAIVTGATPTGSLAGLERRGGVAVALMALGAMVSRRGRRKTVTRP